MNIKKFCYRLILLSTYFFKDLNEMLKNYDSDGTVNIYSNKISKEDQSIIFRQKMIIDINECIKYNCKKFNIKFIDNTNKILMKNYHCKKIFLLPHNELNIHSIFEYILMLYLYHDLNFLLKSYNFNDIIDKMELGYNKYLQNTLSKHNMLESYDKYKFNRNIIF